MKNKRKKLTLGSFKRFGKQGSFQHYFSCILEDGKKICLESCPSGYGYDVAIYDENKDLIGEKTCTGIEDFLIPGFSMGTGEALEKAIKIANQKLSKLDKEDDEN